MLQGTGTPERQGRIRFERGFNGDARSQYHHLKHHDVERALRWPRSMDELTSAATRSQCVAVWVASPPMVKPAPSSILVITREHRNARHVQDAWRIYHGDVDLSRVRSAGEAFEAFLGRYGLELQIGLERRRLFRDCQIPMGPCGNTSAKLPAAAADIEVRRLQILKLIPETAVVEVSVAYAINETAVRLDLRRHENCSPGSQATTPRQIGMRA
jgi:hypothetical protein